ncbi:MAG: single-stranded DNA-binding protein [Isosphaeraceae bacterium]|nr:single-stranded DNA-binding protein [Isosphaeraceae bacterium]
MASLNRVFLIGNLTRDPELRYTPGGSAVTDLPLAINRNFTTKDGERREEVTYIDVTVWERQAENCCQYLKKGRPVHVEGSLRMESWEDKTTGEKRSKLKVLAERVQFLDSRRDDGGGAGDGDFGPPAAREVPAPRRAAGEARGATNGPARGFAAPGSTPPPARRPVESDAEDDDIPF